MPREECARRPGASRDELFWRGPCRVNGYPVLLEGTRIEALVVGGGSVAWRKAHRLLECGARVRMVAPDICAAARDAAGSCPRLALHERAYARNDIGRATLVFAATDSRMVNAQVASDASRAGRLVNVADVPTDGDFVTVAAYRADPLVVGVSSGVPKAATRIRDAIAARFDGRYRAAVAALAGLRQRLLARGEAADWRAAESALIDEHFCARVEDGTFAARLDQWEAGLLSDPADATWR